MNLTAKLVQETFSEAYRPSLDARCKIKYQIQTYMYRLRYRTDKSFGAVIPAGSIHATNQTLASPESRNLERLK